MVGRGQRIKDGRCVEEGLKNLLAKCVSEHRIMADYGSERNGKLAVRVSDQRRYTNLICYG